MYLEFPKSNNQFMKAEAFQDAPTVLTFKGWDKKANVDDDKSKKGAKDWKAKLPYMLRYSYPEWAIDPTTGDKRVHEGEHFRNKNYDPNFPQGYSIVYSFQEGTLESGSLPLFEAFCQLRPKAGDTIVITRIGKDKETKWSVKQSRELKDIQIDDESNVDKLPF